MGNTKLDETCIFKIGIKPDSFYVYIGIKIPFFRLLVTIEPSHSLLRFVTTLFDTFSKGLIRFKILEILWKYLLFSPNCPGV